MVTSDAWDHSRYETAWEIVEAARAEGRLHDAAIAAEQLLQDAVAAGAAAYPEARYDLPLAQLTLARILRAGSGAERALLLLLDARHGFEELERQGSGNAARMVTVCIGEQGECLLRLGRLEEAAAACEAGIDRARRAHDETSLAVSFVRLGSVRLRQRRYQQSLAAYREAMQQFSQQQDSRALATTLYQTGSVYLETGQVEAADDAYQQALALYTELDDVAAQADTLTQLGAVGQLVPGRTMAAIGFYRTATEKYAAIRDVAGESRGRSNLAYLLLRLRHLEEARHEIERALACQAQLGLQSEPWKSWAILEQIETMADDRDAAGRARREAIGSYLAYRRQGGENPTKAGQLCRAVMQSLLAGDQLTAGLLLQQTEAVPNLPDNARALVRALVAIVAGNRSRTLADHPALEYAMAAEILWLIEVLEART